MAVAITTNHAPRDVLNPWDLTAAERIDFDYLDWAKLEAGEDSASFFRYQGDTYDLGEFTSIQHPYFGMPDSALAAAGWHGIQTDSAFSAILVRYCDDQEQVIIGRVLA
jgi:hypothetical protein